MMEQFLCQAGPTHRPLSRATPEQEAESLIDGSRCVRPAGHHGVSVLPPDQLELMVDLILRENKEPGEKISSNQHLETATEDKRFLIDIKDVNVSKTPVI